MAAREKVLYQLKARGPRTAAQMAKRLGLTSMAVRQHLASLEEDGLVAFTYDRRGIGRPARIWELTEKANHRFPDSHGELTVGILQAMRDAFGEKGLVKLVEARTKAQLANYLRRLPSRKTPLEKRVAALTALRKEEGYMAEWKRNRDGSFLLIENHCPICAAARECQGLCLGELSLFRSALGRGAKIERTEHLLDGARRCVYRISK